MTGLAFGEQGFACNLCFPGRTEYGELVPGYFLVEHADHWLLLGHQGHRDDEVLAWSVKPYADPTPRNYTEETAAWTRDARCRQSGGEEVLLSPIEGYLLVRACNKAGYRSRRHGDLMLWLYSRAARLISMAEVEQHA